MKYKINKKSGGNEIKTLKSEINMKHEEILLYGNDSRGIGM
jgi:hypothetical protein